MHKKVIFFDLYQTLINAPIGKEKEGREAGFAQVIIPYLLQRGVSETDASFAPTFYSEKHQAFYSDHDVELFHHNFAGILSGVFSTRFNLALSDSEMSDLIYEFRKVSRMGPLLIYEGVREALEALSKEHTLILASYTQGSYSDRELAELGILTYFAHRIYSSDIGFKKKSDAFYTKCIEIAGVDAGNCLMIGDNLYEDMYMANRNGLRTLWIINPNSRDRVKAEIVPDGSLPIESMRDLPLAVAKILGA